MLEAPVFWITFSGISYKLMPRAKADFTKNNSFKAFSGFWQGNTLIQPQCSADSQLFHAKQSEHPNPMPTSGSGPPSLRPVTYRDGRCVGFKTLHGKIYHEARILARWANVEQRHFSPNQPIWPELKSVLVKVRVASRHPDRGHRPAKPGEMFYNILSLLFSIS